MWCCCRIRLIERKSSLFNSKVLLQICRTKVNWKPSTWSPTFQIICWSSDWEHLHPWGLQRLEVEGRCWWSLNSVQKILNVNPTMDLYWSLSLVQTSSRFLFLNLYLRIYRKLVFIWYSWTGFGAACEEKTDDRGILASSFLLCYTMESMISVARVTRIRENTHKALGTATEWATAL